MPGTTSPFGYPYPSASDPIADAAAKVQDLAQAVDDQVGMVKIGTQASGTLVAGTPSTQAVTFAVAFPVGVTPRVVACLENVLGTAVYQVDVRSVTRTGFTLGYLRSVGTASMTAHWIAVGQ